MKNLKGFKQGLKNWLKTMPAAIAGASLLCGAMIGSVWADGEGGISGGGGGVVPSDNVEAAMIKSAIQQSRLNLYVYFNKMSELHRSYPGMVAGGALLFDGKQTIFEVIQTAAIEVKEDGACMDPAREDKDGAAPGSKPNSICISVSNLSQKLSVDNYWNQTIALVGHEFSHLLGANEVQAIDIQKQLIGIYRHIPQGLPADMRINAPSSLQHVMAMGSWAQYRIAHPNEGDPNDLGNALSRLAQDMDAQLQTNYFFPAGLSIFNRSQKDQYWGAYRKIEMLALAGCASSGAENPRESICKERLDHVFGSASEVTLPVIEHQLNGNPSLENPPGFVIRRIVNESILKQELDEALEMLNQLTKSVNEAPAIWGAYDPNDGSAVIPSANNISWKSKRVSLTADDFRITAEGKNYYGSPSGAEINSDPGYVDYWTFEIIWMENGIEMRMNMYFAADSTHWWVKEIRTYDGRESGEWVTYRGTFFKSPLGTAFNGNLDLSGKSGNGVDCSLHIRNMTLQSLLH